jgi:hypothetical protein
MSSLSLLASAAPLFPHGQCTFAIQILVSFVIPNKEATLSICHKIILISLVEVLKIIEIVKLAKYLALDLQE